MSTILLSIKPQFARSIFAGSKQYEFRKNRSRADVDHIVFYVSSPERKVVGEAMIDEVLDGAPADVWEQSRQAAGITEDFYNAYYAGRDRAIAYKLKDVSMYETPRPLSDYGIRQAPQSFVYLN